MFVPFCQFWLFCTSHVVPSAGGQTEWADMRAAYDALDAATRERIEGLTAHHSLRYSQAKIGHQARAVRASQHRGEIEHADTLQRTRPWVGRVNCHAQLAALRSRKRGLPIRL